MITGLRRRLVTAASGVTGARFRALAAASVIATSAIIGSALAGGDTGLLAALVAQAEGQAGAQADDAIAGTDAPGGPAIPPPPTIPSGGPAPSPAPAPVSQAPAAAPAAEQPAAEEPAAEPEPEPEAPAEPTIGSGPVKHIFVISLSSPGYEETFGEQSLMPYLNETLRPEGELLAEYSLLTTTGLPNYIAMISGQPPNALTKANCTTYANYPETAAPDKDGVVSGPGCVYPVQALTIVDQLNSGGLLWRAYMEDMANDFGPANCVHPGFEELDQPEQGGYAASHNPFAYFHSLLDLGACGTNDVPLDGLTKDLKKLETTPNYAFISPNLCNSGALDQCPVDPAAAGTLVPDPAADPTAADTAARAQAAASADAFLKQWVPRIRKSAAFKKGGLLVITFGEAQPPEGATEPTKVGALLLSPMAPVGATLGTPYDPYSLLLSTQELFGVSPLANAGAKGTESFASQLLGGGD